MKNCGFHFLAAASRTLSSVKLSNVQINFCLVIIIANKLFLRFEVPVRVGVVLSNESLINSVACSKTSSIKYKGGNNSTTQHKKSLKNMHAPRITEMLQS